ncbi:MAG: DNA polymerase III subunit gamma/tau [Lachnospiraceae bacterium]|nr:DNA polymerase III subunit gamma/tau [Lachnospiraceae bacterium]
MSYTALYRKFRPRTFDEVKGQDPIVTTLKNQIKNERTSHAYLFCGTRGTGKTSIAKIFARAVNCENPNDGSPCGECSLCKAILQGSSMNVIEMDAASNNGVDDIRQIVEEVSYSPTQGKYKVYIIDEVHMLSSGAFNALLKTLEEPPEYVIFILATTEVHKLPITILSRCQRYDFRRISIDEISDRIKELLDVEGVEVEDKAVRYIAKTADGSMRDALSLLDQCIAFYFEQRLTYDKVLDVLGAVDTEVFSEIVRFIIKGDVVNTLKVLEKITIQGRELTQFVNDLVWYLRNMLLLKTSEANEEIVDLSSENMLRLKEEASTVPTEVLMRYIRILSELSGQIKFANQKRILIEVALIKLCRPMMEVDNESLSDRIRQLEQKISEGIVVRSATETRVEQSDSAPKKDLKELAAALPEDIKNIVSKWNVIVSDIDPIFYQYLSDAYPSIEGEDILTIVFRQSYGYQRFSDSERLEELRTAISNIVDADIKLSVKLGDGINASKDMYPDLRSFVEEKIDFEIEEISDEESEDEYSFEEYDIERNSEDG